jgi:hypothetical protein
LQKRAQAMSFINKIHIRKCRLVVFLFTMIATAYGQNEFTSEVKKDISVKKRTVLERFDSDLVITPEERMKLKLERIATIEKRLEIMDTLNISDRQRRRLLKELYRSPFSDEWNKVIADLEFEELTH